MQILSKKERGQPPIVAMAQVFASHSGFVDFDDNVFISRTLQERQMPRNFKSAALPTPRRTIAFSRFAQIETKKMMLKTM